MRSLITNVALLSATLARLPTGLAMPFAPPFWNDTLDLNDPDVTVTFFDDTGHELFVRSIDDQEAIGFANLTFYSLKQDEEEQSESACAVSHLARYVPVMNTENVLDEIFIQSYFGQGAITGVANNAAARCPPYDPSKFTRKPLSAQNWWDRQKKLDAKSSKRLGDSPLQPRFPKAPRWVNYACCGDEDGEAPLPTAEKLGPINVLNLGFLTLRRPEGDLEKFFQLSVAKRRKWLHSMHLAGISVIMSTFGGDDTPPVMNHYDPFAIGKLHGEVAKEAGFDGIDIDWEDIDAANLQSHAATGWMEAYVNAVRSEIPVGKYALTAAPIAPWFTTNTDTYCSGMYRTIDEKVGDLHDWYNIQFYNQGRGTYSTCADILTKSDVGGDYPHSSVFEIHEKGGVDLQKLVIGKPTKGRAASGHVSASLIAKCVAQAKHKGWKAGVMTWQWPDSDAQWWKTIRGNAFPATEKKKKKE